MPETSQTGFFISFEGSEGCGKSTQIRRLAAALSARGTRPVVLREPGGTPIGEKIRHLLQHSRKAAAMTAETELLLFAASRAQLVGERILPALSAGRIVISDRFLDSTTVYQGVARKIPGSIVATVNAFAAGSRLPDMTFLLDMPVPAAMARLQKRLKRRRRDRMEREPGAFFEAVRHGYLELASREPARFRVLDGSSPAAEIAAHILATITQHALYQRICA